MVDPNHITLHAPVSFHHHGQSIAGYIARKSRCVAVVVADDGSEYRVPWSLLSLREGVEPRQVNTRTATLKARFRPHDAVEFQHKSESFRGVIATLGPRRARVSCDNDKTFYVPYALLKQVSPNARKDDTRRLAALAQKAERLILAHGLPSWSFQFDDASRRAGCCHYDAKVISLSRLYCLNAPDKQVRNTILHEIAHALVGPEHHHDSVWKAKARSIGCTGDRCHNVEFAPPRYIATCPRCAWIQGTYQRRRQAICATCREPISYRTFTLKAWEEARRGSQK